jgi:hypothetical protein
MSAFTRQLLVAVCAGLLLVSSFTLSHAQPGVARPGVTAPDKRERVKQKVRAMRAYVLTDALALDPSTAGKMFPVIEKYDNESDALTVVRAGLRAKLDITTDSKSLNKVIDDLLANQKAMFDMEAKRLVELRAILTPQQVAKLITVLPDFERRLQNRLSKGKANRKANPFGEPDADDANNELAPARQPGSRRNRDDESSDAPRNPFSGGGAGSAAGKPGRKCDPFSTRGGCK